MSVPQRGQLNRIRREFAELRARTAKELARRQTVEQTKRECRAWLQRNDSLTARGSRR